MSIKSIINRLRYHPWKREVRFLWQRVHRGWDDGETFSLDYSLAKLIAPRLKRFRDITIATPHEIKEKEWIEILDKMVDAFEFAGSSHRWEASDAEFEKHQEGLDLFAKHFFGLWW